MLDHDFRRPFKYFGYTAQLGFTYKPYFGKLWVIILQKDNYVGEYFVHQAQPLAAWKRVIKILKRKIAKGLDNARP